MDLDLSTLRAFATAVELGGFGRAARRLHRSPGAVSLKLKGLEERLGVQLFLREGKQQSLTASGEMLFGYARRMLQLNDEALLALRGLNSSGEVRFGMTQDLADSWLPYTLGSFARTCPAVRLEIRVDSSAQLQRALAEGELDLAVVFGSPDAQDATQAAQLAVRWWGSPDLVLAPGEPIPLLLFDSPCTFREAAIRALDEAGLPWRIVLSSRSVSAIWAAAQASLGITARAAIHVPRSLLAIDLAQRLPPLGAVGLFLRTGAGTSHPATQHLAGLVRETVELKMGGTEDTISRASL
jgi:DNA-binding transcriptional LysR family regulator